MTGNIVVKIADYHDSNDAAAIVTVLNGYACDPMGGGAALTPYVCENLVAELAKRAHGFSVLVYVDGKAAALANCFEGFSTFTCKPLINIHDIAVMSEFRGLGLSQRLLAEVEREALERDCCKITLEVLEGNTIAQHSYRKFGFAGYELDPKMGRAMFWQKSLPQ